jgi:hypothetical protein
VKLRLWVRVPWCVERIRLINELILPLWRIRRCPDCRLRILIVWVTGSLEVRLISSAIVIILNLIHCRVVEKVEDKWREEGGDEYQRGTGRNQSPGCIIQWSNPKRGMYLFGITCVKSRIRLFLPFVIVCPRPWNVWFARGVHFGNVV